MIFYRTFWTKDRLNVYFDEMDQNLELLNKLGSSQSEFLFNQDFLVVERFTVNFFASQFQCFDIEVMLKPGVLGQ